MTQNELLVKTFLELNNCMKINEITDITRATPDNREVFRNKTSAIQRVETLPDEIVEDDDDSSVKSMSNAESSRSVKNTRLHRRSEK